MEADLLADDLYELLTGSADPQIEDVNTNSLPIVSPASPSWDVVEYTPHTPRKSPSPSSSISNVLRAQLEKRNTGATERSHRPAFTYPNSLAHISVIQPSHTTILW